MKGGTRTVRDVNIFNYVRISTWRRSFIEGNSRVVPSVWEKRVLLSRLRRLTQLRKPLRFPQLLKLFDCRGSVASEMVVGVCEDNYAALPHLVTEVDGDTVKDACRRAIQRILAVVKKKFEDGKYKNHVEAEADFRHLVDREEGCK